jgi:HEAT repeat
MAHCCITATTAVLTAVSGRLLTLLTLPPLPLLLLLLLSHCTALHHTHTLQQANNHVVREGACHCIAEMAAKVDPAAVASHVPVLLTALLSCFADESWPVRDAACVATGRFAAAFPQQCRPQLDTLYERWFKHLAEPIWSVREDSAAALGQVLTPYRLLYTMSSFVILYNTYHKCHVRTA